MTETLAAFLVWTSLAAIVLSYLYTPWFGVTWLIFAALWLVIRAMEKCECSSK